MTEHTCNACGNSISATAIDPAGMAAKLTVVVEEPASTSRTTPRVDGDSAISSRQAWVHEVIVPDASAQSLMQEIAGVAWSTLDNYRDTEAQNRRTVTIHIEWLDRAAVLPTAGSA
jgi:hypothetical protein